MKTVLFACVHNVGRSQMAAALFNAVADPAKVVAVSAGSDPGVRVDPVVAEAMRELGVDLSAHAPTLLTARLTVEVSYLVTMGCGYVCPLIPLLRREDWPLEDPVGKPLAEVRRIRDAIRQRVRALVSERGWARGR